MPIPFDDLYPNEELWATSPDEHFSVVFLNARLHIVHDGIDTSWAEELSDDDIKALLVVLTEFQAWQTS